MTKHNTRTHSNKQSSCQFVDPMRPFSRNTTAVPMCSGMFIYQKYESRLLLYLEVPQTTMTSCNEIHPSVEVEEYKRSSATTSSKVHTSVEVGAPKTATTTHKPTSGTEPHTSVEVKNFKSAFNPTSGNEPHIPVEVEKSKKGFCDKASKVPERPLKAHMENLNSKIM